MKLNGCRLQKSSWSHPLSKSCQKKNEETWEQYTQKNWYPDTATSTDAIIFGHANKII